MMKPCPMESCLTPSLSESLRHETSALHTQVERSPFMHSLLRGRMRRHGYCLMLRNLQAIYAALEPALERHAAVALLAPLHFPALRREATLRRDLETLHGADWQEALAVQPAATRYVARLSQLDEAQPELLVAHSYVRYLGDLSGGQLLRRIVRDSLALLPGAGTAFYEFGDAAATARLKKAYREGLDALAPEPATARAIVAEAMAAFELHGQLFDELALAIKR
jgi:heme oxygenase (biliverdin-producing, ferredoxin)